MYLRPGRTTYSSTCAREERQSDLMAGFHHTGIVTSGAPLARYVCTYVRSRSEAVGFEGRIPSHGNMMMSIYIHDTGLRWCLTVSGADIWCCVCGVACSSCRVHLFGVRDRELMRMLRNHGSLRIWAVLCKKWACITCQCANTALIPLPDHAPEAKGGMWDLV